MKWVWKFIIEESQGLILSGKVIEFLSGVFLLRIILRSVLNLIIALSFKGDPNIKTFSVDKYGAIEFKRFSKQKSVDDST